MVAPLLAHPLPSLPRVVRMPCPADCDRGQVYTYPSLWSELLGRGAVAVGCKDCAATGWVTLHLGVCGGELWGVAMEPGVIGTFADEDDAGRLLWAHCEPLNPLSSAAPIRWMWAAA